MRPRDANIATERGRIKKTSNDDSTYASWITEHEIDEEKKALKFLKTHDGSRSQQNVDSMISKTQKQFVCAAHFFSLYFIEIV